jgi:7-carboxy-7-deazaguanine synthase
LSDRPEATQERVPDSDKPAETRPGFLPQWQDDGRRLLVNEIFYSIEGEGLRVGEPTTFVRLSHCNLRCHFCDTDFDSFVEMDVEAIIDTVGRHPARWVCLTGGEPLGQNIEELARSLRGVGYHLHIETNGTLSPPPVLFDLIDHWTVSPKRDPMADGFRRITELKYVVGKAFREDRVQEELADWVYLQPESSEPRHVEKALEVLTRHPNWRLSCRVHKTLGLP